jgi:hypothetical protein
MTLSPCASSRIRLSWFAAAALMAAAQPGLAAQQPQQPPQPRPVSATMLRILAEAADVYRTGKPIYLVADYRYPHNVLRGFPNRTAAVKAQKDSASNYGLFGPYVTPVDPIPAAAPRVVAITVTTRTAAGDQTYKVDPESADALFFTLSAVDKFVLPYYQKTLGPAYAEQLRNKVIDQLRDGAFMRHCWSWICSDPGPGPIPVFDPAAYPPQGPVTPGSIPQGPIVPTGRDPTAPPAP